MDKVWFRMTFRLWPPNSTQFILESKWGFVPDLKRILQGVPRISHSRVKLWPALCFMKTRWPLTTKFYAVHPGVQVSICANSKRVPQGAREILPFSKTGQKHKASSEQHHDLAYADINQTEIVCEELKRRRQQALNICGNSLETIAEYAFQSLFLKICYESKGVFFKILMKISDNIYYRNKNLVEDVWCLTQWFFHNAIIQKRNLKPSLFTIQ